MPFFHIVTSGGAICEIFLKIDDIGLIQSVIWYFVRDVSSHGSAPESGSLSRRTAMAPFAVIRIDLCKYLRRRLRDESE